MTTMQLTMAGGGSHAWNYELRWQTANEDEVAVVYVHRHPFLDNEYELQQGKALLHCANDDGTEAVVLVDDDEVDGVLQQHPNAHHFVNPRAH